MVDKTGQFKTNYLYNYLFASVIIFGKLGPLSLTSGAAIGFYQLKFKEEKNCRENVKKCKGESKENKEHSSYMVWPDCLCALDFWEYT